MIYRYLQSKLPVSRKKYDKVTAALKSDIKRLQSYLPKPEGTGELSGKAVYFGDYTNIYNCNIRLDQIILTGADNYINLNSCTFIKQEGGFTPVKWDGELPNSSQIQP